MQQPGVSKKQEEKGQKPKTKNTKIFRDLYQISMNLIQPILQPTQPLK
jgi:hypothetical protein